MQFELFVVISALTTSLMATSLTARDTTVTSGPGNGYTQLYREEASTGDGHLIYYDLGDSGTNTRRSEPGSLEERATYTTTGNTIYSSDNEARNDVCDTLVQELHTDYNFPIDITPRQICYLGTSEKNSHCCVSWHDTIPNPIKGDLYDIANNSKQPSLYFNYKICTKGIALTSSSVHTPHPKRTFGHDY
jgi:hypothetical protein